jgi:lipooligosaccharide transport system permease protein
MSVNSTRVGSLKLVNPAKIKRFGTLYVAEARIRTLWKWRISILSGSLLSPFFYLTSLGVGVGTLINARVGNAGVDGVSYVKFIAPALIAQVAMNDFMTESTFPVLHGFKWEKVFFAMNATTLNGRQIALGTYLAAATKTLVTTSIYYGVLSLFGAVHFWGDFLMILAVVYAAGCFAAIMMGAAATPENDDLFLNIMGRLLIMPLFLFSGTFYPLHSMPTILEYVGYVSPLWHSVELARWIAYGHSIQGNVLAIHFVYLAVMFVAGIWYSAKRFEYRLTK